MKKALPVIFLLCAVCTALSAQSFNEWRDPVVNAVNRAPMHSHFFSYESASAASGAPESSANYLGLDGLWKFDWVRDADCRPTDFWKMDFNDRGWDSMTVPVIWELNGYGDPLYVNIEYAWDNQFKNNPPFVPVKDNHVGSYRREIAVPASWKGREIIAHFGSVTSNIYLWVNGKFVGYSEDSKLEAEFDLTKFLRPGESNLIAFQVFRWCDGTYLECQDFWRLSGVARDCYLYSRPKKHVTDVRVDPDLDSSYKDGTLNVHVTASSKLAVTAELIDPEGNTIAIGDAVGAEADFSFKVPDARKWSSETPHLYTVRVSTPEEVIPVRTGFRKVEIRDRQLLVNGQPVLIKGANRHEIDPDGGYSVSRERMLQDISIMKHFSINAVRTCHYPDDSYFYDLCDQYGIYLVAEANIESHGMGYGDETLAKREDYRKAHLERNERNVLRNSNHPSVIIWSLGNEAGYGRNFEDAYDLVKDMDAQRRPVQYERAGVDGKSDIFCPMYMDYEHVIRTCENQSFTKPLIQCEYAHAMGNSEGGFREYWELIRKYPEYQGGFIWDFVDQSLRWTGKNGRMIYAYGGDFNSTDVSTQNFNDNGLVSPDRVPNPHMYEVGYWYQNIWTTLAGEGRLEVFNENFFRRLDYCTLEWELLHDGTVVRRGSVHGIDIAPQERACVEVPYGKTDGEGEWLLNVAYTLDEAEGLLEAGCVLARQQLVLGGSPEALPAFGNPKAGNAGIVLPEIVDIDRNFLTVRGNGFHITFSRRDGFLCGYEISGRNMLADGASLTPNFWRAPTDNDFGAKLQKKLRVWKDPAMNLTSLDYKIEDGLACIFAKYDMPEVGASLGMEYRVNSEGAVEVSESLVPTGTKDSPELFRFGVQMPLKQDFSRVRWYGRGPGENYADRHDNTFLGIWHRSVADMFYPYIRPQENGTRTDIRWWTLYDMSGRGICIKAGEPFSASALNYTVESLDEGLEKRQMHSPEVDPAPLVNLLVDKAQMGLGCVNSWRALPLEKHRLPFGKYEFTFVIVPVKNVL